MSEQMKKNVFCISLFFIVNSLIAQVLPVGDFSTLKNWNGLTAVSEKTPDGDLCAKFNTANAVTFNYTTPKTYLGWENPGFADMLEEITVEDWFDHRYIEFEVKLPEKGRFELEFVVYPLRIGRPDYMQQVSTKCIVSDKGWNKIVLDLREFDYPHHLATFWKYVDSISFSGGYVDDSKDYDVFVSQPRVKQGRLLAVSSSVQSKPAKIDEAAEYELTVENETARPRQVTLNVEKSGWEACNAKLSEDSFTLEPWERKQVSLSVEMNSLVAAGGRESRIVTAIADGRADLKEQIELTTVRYLPHPYLLHTEQGWQAVNDKADKYEWAKERKEDYIAEATKWKVPGIRKADFCYKLDDAKAMSRAAIAWKLSGDEKIERKVAAFLRDFSNPDTGYLSILKSNNGTHVHEGVFFANTAMAYDLLYDKLSEQDHSNMEAAFRRYIRGVKCNIRTGDGNNHQVSLVAGAVLCGLAMQDFNIVNEMLHGTGGYKDLMSAGILDDGYYFEGTINYNMLVANIANTVVIALEPWGINAKDWNFEPRYGKFIMISDWARRGDFLGMSFEKVGPSNRNWRNIKDLWDTIAMMSDYRGSAFASSDSIEKDLTGENEHGFGFEAAYYLYQDEKYIPIIKLCEKRDLLYGVGELPESKFQLGRQSYFADNVGVAVLRSQTADRGPEEQIQVVQRYGTHGGYHGHFDKTSLLSLMRYGRSFYGTEASWYGYGSFMFKMWVQSSSAHNMVVVDGKMQKPADNRRILFHSGDMMQVSAAEIKTAWIDPPYGGQTPYKLSMPQEKSWDEGRWLPTPEVIRPQGDTGEMTEDVLQRRLIILTDDYAVVGDFVSAQGEHNYDNLFHCKGLGSIDAQSKVFKRHTAQMSSDPYSSGQFITNCNWFEMAGTVKASFALDFNNPDMLERVPTSLPGKLNIDYYSLWPKTADVMVGNYADSQNVARHLYYKVFVDGKAAVDDKLAPWILGAGQIDISLEGASTLEIETKIENAAQIKTIFLGDPYIETQTGDKLYLCDVNLEYENIALAPKAASDYYGDKVTIFGDDYLMPVAAEPQDRTLPGRIKADLKGLKASRFKAVIGGDYPAKSEFVQRKTIAVRTTGKQARYLSVIEPYGDKKMIKAVSAASADELEIELADGKKHVIKIANFENDKDIKVSIQEYIGGDMVREEYTN